MATNRDLLKEAIADAKAVKHMAIANAKAALEEAFTPQVNALFSAKLREMEEVNEEDYLNEVEEEEEESTEEESTEEEAPEEESEEEDEDGETKIEDMTEEDLAKLIEDIMLEEFPELAKMRGEEAEETEEEGAEEEGEEIDMNMDMDLAELLREIEDDSVEESDINLDELLAEIAAEEGMLDEEYEEEKMMETELRSELAEAYNAIDVLRSELTEINMLNAKLLYTNKIFKSKNLSESQKVKVLSSFDKAVTVKEVKLVYETLNEGLKVKIAPTNNNVGRASKSTFSPTVKKPIIESNEAFKRMQKLAGLI